MGKGLFIIAMYTIILAFFYVLLQIGLALVSSIFVIDDIVLYLAEKRILNIFRIISGVLSFYIFYLMNKKDEED